MAATTHQSVSEVVNDVVRLVLCQGQEDLSAFSQRAKGYLKIRFNYKKNIFEIDPGFLNISEDDHPGVSVYFQPCDLYQAYSDGEHVSGCML